MSHHNWVFSTGMAFAGLLGMTRPSTSGARRRRKAAGDAGADSALPVLTRRQPRLKSFMSLGPSGFHRVSYTEWGDVANPHVVVCLHGFTRNSRDFDVLADSLADRCRVICMDVVGRGASDWLTRKEDYDYSLYLSDAAALLGHVIATAREASPSAPAPSIDWIGTSMGGLIGMLLAAKANTPIRRLVLNDVGALVPWAALARLRSMHMPLGVRFQSVDQAEEHLRYIFASFGPLHDEGWRHVAHHSVQAADDGHYVLAYDPGIMSNFNHARNGIEFGPDFLSGVDLWPYWDRLRSPTLVLRGKESDVLPSSVMREMLRRGPESRFIEFPGVGHAPWLMTPDQIGVVEEFLFEG